MKRVLTQIMLLATVAAWSSSCGKNPAAPSKTESSPPPTAQVPQRTITGQVREVNGGRLAGVMIRSWSQSQSGFIDVGPTAADGTFQIEQFNRYSLSFSKGGYESRSWTVPTNASVDARFNLTVKMQPAFSVVPGAALASEITDDDLTYSADGGGGDTELDWIGDYLCGPCKLISSPPVLDGVTLRLSWSGSGPLTMWAGDWYSGPTVVVTGEPGRSELIAKIPSGSRLNTILIGFDRRDGYITFNGEPVSFKLTMAIP